MDVAFRCNALKCRRQLSDQAVVTTCSHIFCLGCSNSLGLSKTNSEGRICPACDTHLNNPDDAVVSSLNPPEDYKTSVLSGLTPSIIMECAGRGLAFHSYQASQEIVYQEYVAKGLTEKHAALSTQMDQVVHDANAEVLNLRNKLETLQSDFESLKNKNQELSVSYSEKFRTCARAQKMYDELKKQMLQLDVQKAAADAVSQTLDPLQNDQLPPGPLQSVHQRNQSIYKGSAIRESHPYRPNGSSGSGGRITSPLQNPRKPQYIYGQREQHGNFSTPTHHRTRLPLAASRLPNENNLSRNHSDDALELNTRRQNQHATQQPFRSVHLDGESHFQSNRGLGASYLRTPPKPYR